MDTSADAGSLNFSSAAKTQKNFWLDVRPYFHFYEVPEFEHIQKAVQVAFENDPLLAMRKLNGHLAGIFKIISLGPPKGAVILPRKDFLSGAEERVTVPLTTSSPTQRSREHDLLITIVGADEGAATLIDGRDFDKVFAEYGKVVIPTKAQFYKRTQMRNMNRLVVIDRSGNNKRIPDRLSLHEHSFLLKYKGKEWMCATCNVMHQGPCQFLKEFHAQREAKNQLQIDTLIVGDSSLRHVESVGLKADVTCMSGAFTGQLAIAYEKHPKAPSYRNVIFCAGANDTKVRSDFETDEVCKRIEKSLSRLVSLVESRDDTNFFLLNTVPPRDGEMTPAEFVTTNYFDKRIHKLSVQHDNLQALTVDHYPEKFKDGHPTVACTEKVLRVLNKFNKDLILNKKFITTEKIYAGVTSPWLSGCTGCESRGLFSSGGFCTVCVDDLENNQSHDKDIFNEVCKLLESEFPQGQKRLRGDLTSSSSDDDGCKLLKL